MQGFLGFNVKKGRSMYQKKGRLQSAALRQETKK